MEYSIKESSQSSREIELVLTASDVSTFVDKALNELKQKVKMPGFRPGKVPVHLIKKMYGQAVEQDAVQDAANDKFRLVVQQENLRPIGTPVMHNIERTEDGGAKVAIMYDVIPDFTLADYATISIEEPVHAVTDEEIEIHVNRLLEENGTFEDAESIADKYHVVNVSMQEWDLTTNENLPAKFPEANVFYLNDERLMPEMKELLLNLKVGDETFYTREVGPGFPEKKSYKITIEKIQKLNLAPFTDEFVTEFTKGRLTSTDELKEEFGLQLQDQYEQQSREMVESQLISKLVEANQFELPASVYEEVIDNYIEDLKKQYAKSKEIQKANKEILRSIVEHRAFMSLSWEIIRNKIIEKEDLSVEDYDLDIYVSNRPDQKMSEEKYRKQLLQNESFINSVLAKKAINFVLDFVQTQEVDFNEYQARLDAQQHAAAQMMDGGNSGGHYHADGSWHEGSHDDHAHEFEEHDHDHDHDDHDHQH